MEDTRVFKELLNHLEISLEGKNIFSFHDQSNPKEIDRLMDLALKEDLYLVSDAGSPIISDPAYPIVSSARKSGIEIDSYSGVSSPIMALELSGLPPMPFTFHGFLPRDRGPKENIFLNLLRGTHIFFEAPHRVEETLETLEKLNLNIQVFIVRELSKKFQASHSFLSNEWTKMKSEVNFKGEFVLVIHQPTEQKIGGRELKSLAQEILDKGAAPKLLSKLLGEILDRSTKDIYAELNREKK